MKRFFLLLILLSLSTFTFSTEVTALNPIEKLTISSERFPDGITLNVTLPQGYQENTDKEYVVLFDLHPRSQPYLSGMHDWMSHNGEWPWLNTIIVTNSGEYNTTLSEHYEAVISGKNQKLLDFFQHDLMTTLDKKYRTNGFRIYSGFTGNASLGLYILLNRPEIFNAFIAASPLLAEDHFKILSQAQEKLNSLALPRYLFISTGKSGYEKSHLPNFEALSEIINSSTNKYLTTNIKRFDNAYYMTQPVLAAAHAIEDIFRDINEDLPADSEISKQGAQAIIDHYKYLSEEKFGFNVSAQSSLKSLGFSLLAKAPKKALTVLSIAVKQYPESTFAFSALAKAHFQLEDFTQAIHFQQLAVEKSRILIPWHQRKQQQYLDEYQKALKKYKS
jgi:hypothetical protein